MAKHVLRYLKRTTDLGIQYSSSDSKNPDIEILPTGYCDASFDSDPDDSKSTSGQVFMLSNGVISHSSNKQSCVVHETTAGYSSSSNGSVERVHRTLFDMIRLSHLKGKNIPQ